MFTKLLIVSILIFSSVPSLGQTTVDELFSQGLKSYQGGKFEDAENQFQQALAEQPNNASLLYNLGLAEYRLGKIGPAIGSWRMALARNPSLRDARDAITFAFTKLEHKELPHQVMLLETLRDSYLQWLSLNQALLIFALCFFAFSWVAINYFGLRKRAFEAEAPTPSVPLKLYFLAAVLCAAGALGTMKTIDSMTARATILPKSVGVRAGPDSDQASLFDLYEGLEVYVDLIQNDWAKVSYPGGRSGWVPLNSIQQTK